MLSLFQDQRMPQELVDSIFIIGDPLAPHLGALIHDYLRVILSHRLCQLGPLPPGNLRLKFCVLSFSYLDPSFFEERPILNRFETKLMLLASEMVSVKFNLCLRGCTGFFPCGGLPNPFSKKLLRSHRLQRHIQLKFSMKIILHEIHNHTILVIPSIATKKSTNFCVVFSNCRYYHTTNKDHHSMCIILKERI